MMALSAGDIRRMHTHLARISNARVTQIATPGTIDDNGDPGTPVPVWTGSAVAFLERADTSILSGGVEVQVCTTTLRVYDAAGAPVAQLRAGADWTATTIVVDDRRLTPSTTRRWTITGVEHEQDATLDSVLLTLNDDRTP